MSATGYTPSTDFSQDEADDVGGRSTVRTAELDSELSAIGVQIDALVSDVGQIRRSDGALLDGIVETNSLSAEVLALMGADWNPRGAWLTGTTYAVSDYVEESSTSYLCLVAHTAGTFATDKAAGKWMVVGGSVTSLPATSVTFTPTGTIAAATVQAAIAEAASEAAQKSANLSDLGNVATARSNLSVPSIAELQKMTHQFAAAGGSVDAMSADFTPNVDLGVNHLVFVESVGANTSATPTIDPDGAGAKTIVKGANTALAAGDIPGANYLMMLYWDVTLGKYVLLNPGPKFAATSGDLQMSTGKLIGRTTAGTGNAEEITVGSGLTLSGGTLATSAAGGPITSSGFTQNTARLLGRTTASSGAIEEITVSGNLTFSGGNLGTNLPLTAVSSVGTGTAVYDSMSGSTAQIRSIAAGTGGNTNVSINLSGSTIEISANHPAGGTSLHPDSIIEMANGTLRAMRDVRVGDLVRGENGPAEVLGIWHSGLTGRALWAVDNAAVTGGHLFKTRTGWAAPDPEAYKREAHNKPSAVKGKNGLIELNRGVAGDADAVELMTIGTEILRSNGMYEPVTRLKAYESRGGAEANAPVAHELPVYSVLLDNSQLLFCDGIAVASMA